MAMFFRAELAQPGLQFVDSQTFNGSSPCTRR